MKNDDSGFLDIGTHCSEVSCRQLDYLPIRCVSCCLPFCGLHFRELAHSCPSYDAQRATNSLPVCPLCEKQITTSPLPDQPSLDPNLIIDHHLSNYCPSLSSLVNSSSPSLSTTSPPTSATTTTQQQRQKKARAYVEERSKSMKECTKKKCRTKLVVPIPCENKCGGTFCPRHRAAGDHGCEKIGASTGRRGEENIYGRVGIGERMQGLLKQEGTNGVIGSTKEKKKNPFLLDDLSKTLPSPSKSPPSAISPKKNPLAAIPGNIKTSKHASAERKSAKKALEFRAKKGLLSEREKLEYATMVALESKESNNTKGKDCCIS